MAFIASTLAPFSIDAMPDFVMVAAASSTRMAGQLSHPEIHIEALAGAGIAHIAEVCGASRVSGWIERQAERLEIGAG